MKRQAIRSLIALLISINVVGAAAAVATDLRVVTAPVIATETGEKRDGIIVTKAEYSEWIYYQSDGKIWKHLWSNTEARWLTDSIFVGYS